MDATSLPDLSKTVGVSGNIGDAVEMAQIPRETGELEIDLAKRDLCGRHPDAENERPALGNLTE